MSTRSGSTWAEANQRYVMATLAMVRAALERYIAHATNQTCEDPPDSATEHALSAAAADLPAPSALQTLCAAFGLSSFERDLLLLCAGPDLDGQFPGLCAKAHGDPAKAFPTFGLALAALDAPHWSAINPAAALRRWRMIELGSGHCVASSVLRIDERVLHYLAGVSYLDERLQGLLEPVARRDDLPPSYQTIARRLAELWRRDPCAVQLCGGDLASQRAIAALACADLGMHLFALSASEIAATAAERDTLARLWEREAILSNSALLIECGDFTDESHQKAAMAFVESARSALVVAAREPWQTRNRPIVPLEIKPPTAAEQQTLWQNALGPLAANLNGRLNGLTAQFQLNVQGIQAASAAVLNQRGSPENESLISRLWDACRVQARPRLDDLAQRIEPAATWRDLVLPGAQLQLLQEMAAHVRHRFKVYETWGFARKGTRGLGISALFAGASGTGKTMAAEVLAHELRLDLYRIDLSAVVCKYIGETEKNLRRVFDAAEEGGAILLFDEADALFGKRSEVKDSHDRYANIEVSYLLQRMETYRGLAILTTNLKHALDSAFLRRLRFVVQFPFPDFAQRAEIWQRIFPGITPTEKLDYHKLARLNVVGGNIRNIALNAAFLAADSGEPVRMAHLLQAARGEYVKLEKPLTETEIGGWS